MLRVIGGLLLVAACSTGDRIEECDRLVAVLDKVAACKSLERSQRQQIDQASRAIREALDKLDDVGLDRAPQVNVTATRQSCVKQREDLESNYRKLAPDCLR